MISTFGWICICFILMIIKYAILNPIEDRRLYRLYEARDNVALAAIEGKISQDADEYNFVIESINESLYYMKNNYDFSILLRNAFLRPEVVKDYFEHMMGLVANYDFLMKNYNISDTYFQKSLNVRIYFLKLLIIDPVYFALCLLILMLKIVEKITTFSFKVMGSAERRINIISEINDSYSDYRKMYAK